MYGWRITKEPVQVGQVLDVSMRWDDGECTDEALKGTCAIQCKLGNAKHIEGYYGGFVCLLQGDLVEYGEDESEVVLRNARVLATWTKTP